MLSEQQFYYIYADYSKLIERLLNSLNEYQKRNPLIDVTEQLEVIRNVQYLQDMFHKLYHTILVIDGKYGEMFAERKRLLDKLVSLQKENDQLKTNII